MGCRVLQVIPAVAPRYGGPSVAVVGIARALAAQGHNVQIVTTDADGRGRLPVQTDVDLLYQGVPIRFFRREFSESFKWSRPLADWLERRVSEFDVVHVHAVFSHSSIAAGRACRAHGVPYIVRPLGTLDPWSLSRHAWRKRLLMELGVRNLLRGAAALHYTSEDEQTLARQALPWLPKGVIVPIGVDDALFGGGEAHALAEPYALFLGRLDAKKGVDLLIRAFHEVVGRRPHDDRLRLVIAGEGDASYTDELRHLAQGGPASNRIEFRGWVDGPERETLLREASLFVLASHQENFGIAVVEAMASGVPVIVTRSVNLAGAIADGHAGWVIERSEPALAAAIIAALENEPERRTRGHNARRAAEQFRWPAIGARLGDLYARLQMRATA